MKRVNPLYLIDAIQWFERESLVTGRMATKLRREVLSRCGMKRGAPKPKPTGTRKRREAPKADSRQQALPISNGEGTTSPATP